MSEPEHPPLTARQRVALDWLREQDRYEFVPADRAAQAFVAAGLTPNYRASASGAGTVLSALCEKGLADRAWSDTDAAWRYRAR